MRNNQNLAIGVLTVTAVILFVGTILSTAGGRSDAMAFGQLDRGGDYILLTGQFTENRELLYVTDAAAQRLNVYSYETSTRQFVLWDTVNLARMSGSRRK